jgi:hypothetical protein
MATRGSLKCTQISSTAADVQNTTSKDIFLPLPTEPWRLTGIPKNHGPAHDEYLSMDHPSYMIDPEADTLRRQLMHHYTQVVAPQMVWIDSVQNPFRQLTMPLALQSPALMMSILSVAAGDLWARSQESSHEAEDSRQPWDRYQRRALGHLASHLKEENRSGHDIIKSPQGVDRASPVLAAFLLGSLALKLGNSGAWRLHLRAAWTMLEHWHSCRSPWQPSVDAVKDFLWQEVYSAKVWESVTTFQPLEGLSRRDGSGEHEAPFFHYVGVIRNLSEIERRRSKGEARSIDLLSLASLETTLEESRQRTRHCGGSLTFSSAKARVAFECVVELFHHAGLLYACQVHTEDRFSRRTADTSRKLLFVHLKNVQVTDIIAQDLTWPLFIAGTECHGCSERQNLVQERMRQIMELSGILERPRLLDFLKDLWDLQCRDSQASWINLARLWAERGEPILII